MTPECEHANVASSSGSARHLEQGCRDRPYPASVTSDPARGAAGEGSADEPEPPEEAPARRGPEGEQMRAVRHLDLARKAAQCRSCTTRTAMAAITDSRTSNFFVRTAIARPTPTVAATVTGKLGAASEADRSPARRPRLGRWRGRRLRALRAGFAPGRSGIVATLRGRMWRVRHFLRFGRGGGRWHRLPACGGDSSPETPIVVPTESTSRPWASRSSSPRPTRPAPRRTPRSSSSPPPGRA